MPKGQLLLITPNWPAPNHSAAGVRLMQLVDFFKEENFQITIASTADKSMVNDSDFEGISLASIQLNHSSFDDFIIELNPNVVLLDRFMSEEQFGWRVTESAPNALRVLDTEDLHSLRKSREAALKGRIAWNKEIWLENDMTKREVASILRCDLSLIISSFELELLKNVVPNHKALLVHLPFMVEHLSETVVNEWPSFEMRKDFVFIGFGGHAPNIDAIEYLKRDIWPLIRKKLPEAKINIYGGNLPEKIYRLLNREEGFMIRGWTEDAKEVISQARVMLAPLRFGAGLKGKLLDTMQYGTPSVTTTIGAEGMHENLEWNGKICDSPKTFAEAAIDLYQNQEEWDRCRQNGIDIINTIYDKGTLSSTLSSKIRSIQENLSASRTKNFFGQLLQHHTLNSTKYMAKWIEEKNKK